MRRFTQLLKNINNRLDLPQPIKSQIILEIAADLEDLYQFYLSRGFNKDEAAQKAEEKINLTDDTLNELVLIHLSWFRRLLNRVTEHAQTRWERIIFLLIIFFIAAISTRSIFSSQFFLRSSIAVLPVLGIFLAVILYVIPKFYYLYIKKVHQLKRLRNGLTTITVLGLTNLFLGVFGYITELYLAGTNGVLLLPHLLLTIITPHESSQKSLIDMTDWMIKSSSLVVTTLFVTIFTVLFLYILLNKIIKIERIEAMVLLED